MVTELGVGPVSLCSSLERLALWVSERSPNGTPSACCEDEGAGARDARRTGSSVSISRRCHSRTSRVSLSKASESASATGRAGPAWSWRRHRYFVCPVFLLPSLGTPPPPPALVPPFSLSGNSVSVFIRAKY